MERETVGVVVPILLAIMYLVWKIHTMGKQSAGNTVTFEFGNTDASKAFFQQNPKFFPVFERLMVLGNKCLAQQRQPKNRLEDIGFGLAHTCQEDFLEILFLAVNGYGNGAL